MPRVERQQARHSELYLRRFFAFRRSARAFIIIVRRARAGGGLNRFRNSRRNGRTASGIRNEIIITTNVRL